MMDEFIVKLTEFGPIFDLLFYLYWQRDRDYRELNKRYRVDLRTWTKLEPDETNSDGE